jgi:hypothetical protein
MYITAIRVPLLFLDVLCLFLSINYQLNWQILVHKLFRRQTDRIVSLLSLYLIAIDINLLTAIFHLMLTVRYISNVSAPFQPPNVKPHLILTFSVRS